jgi:hypothetical protein
LKKSFISFQDGWSQGEGVGVESDDEEEKADEGVEVDA